MYKRLMATALLGLALLATSPAAAEAKGGLPPEPQNFTLEVALTRAMRFNPNIQMAEARLAQARLEKESQDLWWARTVRANANYNVLGNQNGYQAVTPDGTILPTAAVGVGINLGDLLAGPKNSARAEQAVVIAEAELKRTTLEVANQITAAYQEYQAAKLVAGWAGEAIEAAEVDLKVSERQFARGASAANTLVGARLAVHRVRTDSVTSTGNVAKTWSNLLTLIGDPGLSVAPVNAATTAERR
jgi:outer membrane protein TolC